MLIRNGKNIFQFLTKYALIILSVIGFASALTLHFWAFSAIIPRHFHVFIDASMFYSVSFKLAYQVAFALFFAALLIEFFRFFFETFISFSLKLFGKIKALRSVRAYRRVILFKKYIYRHKNTCRVSISVLIFSLAYLGIARAIVLLVVFLSYSFMFYVVWSKIKLRKMIFVDKRQHRWLYLYFSPKSLGIENIISSIPYLVLLLMIVSLFSGILRSSRILEDEDVLLESSTISQSGKVFAATSSGFFFFVPKQEKEYLNIKTIFRKFRVPRGKMIFVSYETAPTISQIDD